MYTCTHTSIDICVRVCLFSRATWIIRWSLETCSSYTREIIIFDFCLSLDPLGKREGKRERRRLFKNTVKYRGEFLERLLRISNIYLYHKHVGNMAEYLTISRNKNFQNNNNLCILIEASTFSIELEFWIFSSPSIRPYIFSVDDEISRNEIIFSQAL